MENPEVVFDQCRFCLKLIEPLGSYSIFGESEDSQLKDFVQEMLGIEFTADNSHVCGDCFSMWRMIQDYLLSCAEAHKIVLASKEFVVRAPWLENDEQTQMLIGVSRAVKKLYHEMQMLLRTVHRQAELQQEATRRRKYRKRKRSEENENGKMNKEHEVSSEPVDAVKEEDPVEIDDSAAFQSDNPLEATKEVVINEEKGEPKEGKDDSILDDSITIVELPMDHIDLVDSSSEEVEETDVEEYDVCRFDRAQDEETFKTVCQLCGITTSDMANHLESHIKDSDTEKDHHKQNEQQQHTESDSSSSNSSRCRNIARQLPKPKPKEVDSEERSTPTVVQPNPLKCSVCGVELTSMLTARLHARLHRSKRTYNTGKSKAVARVRINNCEK